MVPSRLQPDIAGIMERAVAAHRRRLLAEGFDGEVPSLGQLDRQIAVDDGLADRMAEIPAAGDGDDAALMQDRLAPEDGQVAIDGEGRQAPGRALPLDPLQRLAADEGTFAEGDAGAEPGLIRVVVRRDVRAPVEITLLHPERIDG